MEAIMPFPTERASTELVHTPGGHFVFLSTFQATKLTVGLLAAFPRGNQSSAFFVQGSVHFTLYRLLLTRII